MSERHMARLRSTGRVWTVTVDGTEGRSIIRRPSEASEMAAELLALEHGGSADDYDVTVITEVPDNVQEKWDRSLAARAESDRLRQEALTEARAVVQTMRDDDMTWQDIAALLDVSPITVKKWAGHA